MGQALLRAVIPGLALLVTANAFAAETPRPATPQPAAASLADGLAVRYYDYRFEHTDDLARFIKSDPGRAGKPLPNLDYTMGDGNVLGSATNDLVGAHITGLMLFDRTGSYGLRVTSNDGVRLTLGGVRLFEDPEMHPDSTSPPLPVEIGTPGLYPIEVLYYEKKGKATLRIEWQIPGTPDFVPVPASAFKHVP